MKFLKLLDPWNVTVDGPGMTIRQQALRARELFPQLVAESRLKYALIDGLPPEHGTRWLIAMAPTFSLQDMRFADLLNERMAAINTWRKSWIFSGRRSPIT